MVRPHRGRAVGIVRIAAAAAPARQHVVGQRLKRPPDLSAIDVERQDRIGRELWRVGVAVARGDVDRLSRHVDRRSRPDPAARWSPCLQSGLVLARGFGASVIV